MSEIIDMDIIEKLVMEKLLCGDHPILESLRRQYERVEEKRVELTGVGFFINYFFPNDVMKMKPSKFQFGDVIGQVADIKYGVGFLLSINDGVISCLEGYTYGDDKWPDGITELQLSYESGEDRDFKELNAILDA